MAIVSDKVIDKLQYRIQQEELSSRIYRAMSIWLDLNGYTGAAKLWKSYSDEELTHAEWAYKQLLDLNILPIVSTLDKPQATFKGLPQIVAMSYKHEVDITEQVEEFAKVCLLNSDFKNLALAQKYCDEQVGELAKTQAWIDKLETFGEDKIALRMLDQEMGEI